MGRKAKTADASKDDVAIHDDDDEDVLVDLTEPLKITSKRTKRQKTKMQKKKIHFNQFLDLDDDAMMCILDFCTPNAVWALSKVCRGLRQLIRTHEAYLINRIIAFRYPNISRSFRLPYLLTEVADTFEDENIVSALFTFNERIISQRAHIRLNPRHPAETTCSCLSCVDRWNNLCLAVDFARWQDHLDDGRPLPHHKPGVDPPEEIRRRSQCREKILDALHRPLFYAMILESHLDSTVRAIQRQSQNKTNRRAHFPMTSREASSGTDHFLGRQGPNLLDPPYQRDQYYMLEVFLPGRAWSKTDKEWKYFNVPHEKDLGLVMERARRFNTDLKKKPSFPSSC